MAIEKSKAKKWNEKAGSTKSEKTRKWEEGAVRGNEGFLHLMKVVVLEGNFKVKQAGSLKNMTMAKKQWEPSGFHYPFWW